MALPEIKYLCCVLKYATLNRCSEYVVVAGAHATTVTRDRLLCSILMITLRSTDDVKALILYSTKLSDLSILMRRQETKPDLALTAC